MPRGRSSYLSRGWDEDLINFSDMMLEALLISLDCLSKKMCAGVLECLEAMEIRECDGLV